MREPGIKFPGQRIAQDRVAFDACRGGVVDLPNAGEVAGPELRGGNRGCADGGRANAGTLPVHKEECLIPADRAAHGRAELILPQHRLLLGLRGEEVSRIERVVAEKLEDGSVEPLVPLLMVAKITPPPVRPYSAKKLLVTILNSSRASTMGVYPTLPPLTFTAVMPSS
jgi:hypothetical protein